MTVRDFSTALGAATHNEIIELQSTSFSVPRVNYWEPVCGCQDKFAVENKRDNKGCQAPF